VGGQHREGALNPSRPAVFLFDPEGLLTSRDSLSKGDATLQPARIRLVKDAEQALKVKPLSVMDKSLVPASGDKHDYFSYGPYWWPDPSKPGGLPYIRRDGEINPESDTGTDDNALTRICESVETLGLAYWFTGDERFARKAAELTRVWFLNAKTAMNPNLQHAQAIPGVTPGRGIGIIESRRLTAVNEGLALLAGSPAWGPADKAAFQEWLAKFYAWLTTSSNGRDEANALNNHGSWYDAQTAHLALVLGRNDDAREILTRGLTRRIAAQIAPDGSQPLEMARTKSLGYSLFNLEALFDCARLADRVGVDWWSFQTKDGRGLLPALLHLAPYLDASKPWPKRDIEAGDRSQIRPLLAEFLKHRDDPALRAVYLKYLPQSDPGDRWQLGAITRRPHQ